ncbi:snoRNA-binding rRNA-processing protein [Aspergillus nanangensis]|uniref:SnoRNA-binding rRNA-processing protein n=1 Tax=Aspergillus nanangensis TaxID=2582783 RepID=A0AAD4GN87_ASPNN|nr:snoRNA-binding rRNA-processing protein [Aspergillus nanangensis]
MPKATSSRAAAARRHNPLAEDLVSGGHLRTQPSNKNKRKSQADDDQGDGERFIDAKMSRKILQMGQDLAEEDEAEQKARRGDTGEKMISAFDYESRLEDDDAFSDEERFKDDQWEDDEDEVEEVEVDPNDLDMFHKFVPRGDEDPIFNPGQDEEAGESTNLADLILEKIAEHEAKQSGDHHPGRFIQGGGLPEDAVQIPAKAVEVYEKVGTILSRYKSGPLPKPFKILPSVPNWQTLLDITRPESWTANAVYAGTRIFISSKPIVAQEFISTVLLDRVRDEIHETKKVNVHTYNAMKKALYKPACFFKGLLFPLVQTGTCTLREAQIVSSVITRVSIPVLHSAAALLRMCDLAAEQSLTSVESAGAVNIFIRIFLEKKYALPYKVIDALVFHFLRFRASDNGDDMMTDGPSRDLGKSHKLPVLWHQSLLVFAQRYRNDITEDQREALLDLLLVRGHRDIGPEVRRELLAGRGRGVVVPDPENQGAIDAGDDTMDVTM